MAGFGREAVKGGFPDEDDLTDLPFAGVAGMVVDTRPGVTAIAGAALTGWRVAGSVAETAGGDRGCRPSQVGPGGGPSARGEEKPNLEICSAGLAESPEAPYNSRLSAEW